jgi:hypothetical protein
MVSSLFLAVLSLAGALPLVLAAISQLRRSFALTASSAYFFSASLSREIDAFVFLSSFAACFLASPSNRPRLRLRLVSSLILCSESWLSLDCTALILRLTNATGVSLARFLAPAICSGPSGDRWPLGLADVREPGLTTPCTFPPAIRRRPVASAAFS